jgi:NET1-associated nuclear protein 1 (U3 small nucleolar RNA-associated protein 17)
VGPRRWPWYDNDLDPISSALTINTVAWQCNTPLQIDQVVPHKKDAAFAVCHLSEIKDEDRHTKVSIFTVSSSTPTSIRSLPFGLRTVVWAPFLNDSGFNLVAITHSWKAVVFGDSQHSFKDKTLSPNGLNLGHQPQRQSIFQDIFGVSAFASVPLTETPSLRHANSPQEILHKPAYSTPPLNELFDSLIKSFLTDRPPDTIVDEEQNPEDFEDADIQDEQPAGVPLITSRHHSRSANPGEMETFTKLFRSCMMGEADEISFPFLC